MQATTLENVKRAKGVDVDTVEKTAAQHNVSRQQIADARKLKRYINQLTIAKAECETALRKLGWDGAFPTVNESDSKVKVIKIFLNPFVCNCFIRYTTPPANKACLMRTAAASQTYMRYAASIFS